MLQQTLKGEVRPEADHQVWFALEESSGIYRGIIQGIRGTSVSFRELYYTGDDGQSWSKVELTPRNAVWASENLTTSVKYFGDMGSARTYRARLTPRAANLW
jgi:hypothetical protein